MSDIRLRPIEPKLQMEILSDSDIEQIHETTIKVLEEVGVKFPSSEALDIFEDAGAKVDRSTEMVWIPRDLLMEALEKAPSQYTLAARDPAYDLPLDGQHSYLSTDGSGVETVDLETDERRQSRKQDLEETARMADYLDQISFYWPMVAAQDVPAPIRALAELEACFSNTVKHIQTETCVSPRETEYAVEMAGIIAGGKDKLKERPMLSAILCSVSPLTQESGTLDSALIMAKYHLPVGFMAMPTCCSTAPATLAGNLVMNNAEVLSGTAMIQLAHPGAPVFYASAPTSMDLRTGAYTGGGPEDHRMGGAINQLADYYDIPCSMGVMATGSKFTDWHAALDNSLATLFPVLTGTDMLTGAGMLYGSRVLSLQQLLMDCEIYDVIDLMARGIEVNPETLALSVIKKVGPGGHFLAEQHTRQHMRDLWVPQLIERSASYEAWEASDRKGPYERAGELARDILETHEPDKLTAGQQEAFDELMREAEKDLGGEHDA